MASIKTTQFAISALLLFLTGCTDRQPQFSGSSSEVLVSEQHPESARASIIRWPFEEALKRLDTADELGDEDFLREQWGLLVPRANLESNVASRNGLAVSVRLAELVQVHVPELRDDARGYLIGLSISRYPHHREAAARAMRESSGRLAVEALFARAVDSDQLVSSAALESLRWKFEGAAMSGASAVQMEDAQLIARNIERLCADTRLPRANVELCGEVIRARR